MKTVDLNDIRLLMQVIEAGSFTAASRVTGVPKSTISHRIATLERVVGTGLLRRTSRSFSLTEAGAKLLPHARAVEDLARQVEQALLEQGRELAGTLRVSCSNAIAQFALSPLLPSFLDKHRHVSIWIEASNRLVDLVAEGFDMTVRGHVGPLRDSVLIQRVVAHSPWSIVASPGFLARHGTPATPSDLSTLPILHFATAPGAPRWTLQSRAGIVEVPITPRFVSDDMAMLRSSAIAHGGIIGLPSYILAPALATGDLAPVLPDWSLPASTISLLTPPRAQSSRLARAFSDVLAAQLPQTVHVEAHARADPH